MAQGSFNTIRKVLDHSFWARFVPEHAQEPSEIDDLHARMVAASTLSLLVWGPVFALVYAFFEAYYLTGALGFFTLQGGVSLLLLRRTGSYSLARNVLTSALFTVLVLIILFTGGIRSPATVWLIGVPLFSVLYEARRGFWMWCGLTLTFFAVLFGLAVFDVPMVQLVSDGSIDLLWLLSLTGVGVLFVGLFLLNGGMQHWLAEFARRGEFERRELERREYERKLAQRKELEAKMMKMDRMITVGTLAASIVHEINNPLSFVQANVQYLRSKWPEGTFSRKEDDAEFSDVLEDVLEGAERIRAIVSELRSFGKAPTKVVESVDIQQTLISALNIGHGEVKHRAKLVTDFEDVPHVQAVGSSLGQIFLNLYVNAAQAIEPGHHSENEVRVSLRRQGSEVVAAFADTGCGIDEDVASRIFEPFVSTKTTGEGMGLGLAICRNLIEEMDGKITFESEVGVGTTFYVHLPLDSRANQPVPDDSAQLASGAESPAAAAVE